MAATKTLSPSNTALEPVPGADGTTWLGQRGGAFAEEHEALSVPLALAREGRRPQALRLHALCITGRALCVRP